MGYAATKYGVSAVEQLMHIIAGKEPTLQISMGLIKKQLVLQTTAVNYRPITKK